ncbi:RNA pseudouridylate synthase domain-containing protein 3-like [Elysia marginata]|uniref:RNA pseudouridylate synthase domain-containing protein 3-like n=1 Tax=Elysia marginata TaxID=1093978 RepID=A0AAV4FJI8_9GAST|nr:RNA pseudouridylate synthase domain-containing protein 3-like [Elysia marginata]
MADLAFRPFSTHLNGQNNLQEGKDGYNELVEDVYKSIVCMNDDIVVLNKPAGLSVYGSTSGTASLEKATIIDALPGLSKKMQVLHLDIGVSLKSFYSGLVVLCKGEEAKKRLEHCLRGSAAQKAQFLSYLVVTVGQPTCSIEKDLTAFISRDFIHNREMSLIQEENNNNARKAGNMMMTSFTVRTLRANEDLGVALVEISINRDKWEAVEALMSHYLSPVLGDSVYSSRTQYVMGVPFRAGAHSVQPGQQRLPPSLKQALQDFQPKWKDHPGSIPLFMHRHKIELRTFPSKASKPLIITAPPPKHFTSLLKNFGLYAGLTIDR